MAIKSAVLVAILAIALPGCSKPPPTSGVGALKLKDPVWATYGWSRNRMNYIIYFTPNTSVGFNADGVAATGKYAKEGDVFEGGLDGYADNSKAPFRVDARKGEIKIEAKTYRLQNGSVFLVQVGTPKVHQLQLSFSPAPKDPEEWPTFAEGEVQRILKENPKIKAFPAEPPPEKPPAKKKP